MERVIFADAVNEKIALRIESTESHFLHGCVGIGLGIAPDAVNAMMVDGKDDAPVPTRYGDRVALDVQRTPMRRGRGTELRDGFRRAVRIFDDVVALGVCDPNVTLCVGTFGARRTEPRQLADVISLRIRKDLDVFFLEITQIEQIAALRR